MKSVFSLSEGQLCPFHDSEWAMCNITNKDCWTYKSEGKPDGVPDNCPLTKGAIVVQVSEDGSKITLTQNEGE